MCPDTDGSCFEMHIKPCFLCVLYHALTMTLNAPKCCNNYYLIFTEYTLPHALYFLFSSYTVLIHTTTLITFPMVLSQLHTCRNHMAKRIVKPIPVKLIETEGIKSRLV